MFSPEVDARIAAALVSLAEDQRAGLAPYPVPRAEICRRAGVSESTLIALETRFRHRLAAALLRDPEVPPHLARRIAKLIS